MAQLLPSKWPSKKRWLQFFKVLSKKESIYFSIFFYLFITSFFFLFIGFYLNKTEIAPSSGGMYVEGVVGYPRFINPIYASVSDVDRDLTELIFSGLMKYDKSGKIQPDLVKDYKILEQGKVYEFYLKENVFWQDSEPLTADDVIFTIETIQNPNIKSPLRSIWLGIEVEKISDLSLRFVLKNPSSIFLENSTLKIIPKHIWEDISPQNFPFTPINLNPTGSGPYKIKSLSQDKDGKITFFDLVENPSYFDKSPYIPKISFKFFESEVQIIEAYKKGEIKGFSPSSITNIPKCALQQASSGGCKEGNNHFFSLPRYFAVFFNPKNSKVLSEKDVRLALNYGTNKDNILNTVFSGQGEIVNSPILPNIYGFKEPTEVYGFDIQKAKDILEQNGFSSRENGFREKNIIKKLPFTFKGGLSVGSRGTGVTELQKCLAKDSQIYPEGDITGYFGQKTKNAVIRFQEKYRQDILDPIGLKNGTGEVRSKTIDKLNIICFGNPEETIPLKFSLYTVDQPFLIQVAESLKNQWGELGVEVEIKRFDINSLERDIVRKRNFEALLFGEVLGSIPDPFPFWHSSQKGELGLNLANYDNKSSDKLLEANRRSLEGKERRNKLEEFQDILIKDAPAVFLYNPDYIYFVSKEIKGINKSIITDPSKRFVDITDWYIETKRVWQ
ncbi:MAG: ABC transporter substrate-binding protein [Patescibacteria group bacterium]|nr:ABC transporter substrate-binding protein [Patescibacteria group bacterium]